MSDETSSVPGAELTGPWWSNDTPLTAETEQAPQEAFFRLEFPGDAAAFSIATGCFYQAWLNGEWPARRTVG
jgi:hypothetical protein